MTSACEKHGTEKVTRRSGIRNGAVRYRAVCRQCEADRGKKYQHLKRKWDRNNTDKRRAHKSVELALLRGDLVAQPCERCGAANAHAHHDDYARPLDVMWLCPKHHKQRHRELQE